MVDETYIGKFEFSGRFPRSMIRQRHGSHDSWKIDHYCPAMAVSSEAFMDLWRSLEPQERYGHLGWAEHHGFESLWNWDMNCWWIIA